MKLVVAEKPSVARDLAQLLGARTKAKGSLTGNGWTVTWCIGHLVELEEPEAYDASWKRWSFASLPMIPDAFRLRPAKRTLDQWRIVRELLRRKDFESVVNACDAGREGELIFRYAHARAGSKLPIERLWISSLTPAAIRAGFDRLKPGHAYDGLAAAARCRSEADWLVGLNATRAMTLVSNKGGVHSIGRVQTPTLALVVDRELEIRRFVSEPFWELSAKIDDSFAAKWRAPSGHSRLGQQPLVEALRQRVEQRLPLTVAQLSEKEIRERPPQLFDLTALQRTANTRFGFSADRTLKVLQTLYERHKAITYPRTSSRYLASDQRSTLPGLVASFDGHPTYGAAAKKLGEKALTISSRIVDDSKVTDHHAIIPTGKLPKLSGDEAKVFDLVARRFLAVFHPDARFQSTEIVLVAAGKQAPPQLGKGKVGRIRDEILTALPEPPDHFVARGRVVVEPGWHAIEPQRASSEPVLPQVRVGQQLPAKLTILDGKTRPPPRYTEASLLAAMETAGRQVKDDELREAMKECGLGTPATRASIIETLIRREYLGREKRLLVPQEKGIELIERLPVPTLRSAELTGEWEARLQRVAYEAHSPEAFMADVRKLVNDTVATMKARQDKTPTSPSLSSAPPVGQCPRCGASVGERRTSFECSACPFSVPRRLASRELATKEVQQLLRQGRTGVLDGFRSKKKRRFRAALSLENGKVVFSFPGKQTPRPQERAPAQNDGLAELTCPLCTKTGLVAGKRAWGCAHWREGCGFVVAYVIDGKKLTAKELIDLVTKGQTRKAKFDSGKGRLHLAEGRAELRLEE